MSAPTTSRVAIFGATGTAGRATALALRDAGHDVVALGRRNPALEGMAFVPVSLEDEGGLHHALAGTDAVVSCIASRTGLPHDAWAIDHAANLRILTAAQAAGVGHFILLSAICVQKPRLAFQHAKLAFETALMASGLTYSIVRPTAFFKSVSGQVERLRKGKRYLMFGDGRLTACTPISDADLGRYMARCLTDADKQSAILPIGGPGPALTPHDMGLALFDALNLPPKFRRVSPRVIQTIGAALRAGGMVSTRLGAKAELARIGHYYATESMLLWDADKARYDAEATPSFGTDTLQDHYRDLASGASTAERGDHAVF